MPFTEQQEARLLEIIREELARLTNARVGAVSETDLRQAMFGKVDGQGN